MSVWAWLGRVRRLRERARARRLATLHPGVRVGRRVRIGRGCRLLVDPRALVALADGCVVDDATTIAAYGSARVTLGSDCFVGHHATIAAHEAVTIGAGTYLAELVSIRDHDHAVGLPPASGVVELEPVAIGDGCWLGSKVTVVRGARIGDETVIGANAVVRGEIPARTVAAGIPARVVRHLEAAE